MIVDTSVLIALLREEPETAQLVSLLLAETGNLRMSMANYVEAAIVIDANDNAVLSERLDLVIRHFEIDLVPVDVEQARSARQAYRRFGKGRHPAGLNFGDCFAYALAKATGEPLLFKGDDFRRTDIRAAA